MTREAHSVSTIQLVKLKQNARHIPNTRHLFRIMAERPTYIDLRSNHDGGTSSGTSSPGGHPSPRVTHVAGDVPPTMSPLDAFAMQSRLLAKQLEQSKTSGRRASRLPPIAVAESLARQRPGYFRAMSTQSGAPTTGGPSHMVHEAGPAGNRMEIESPAFRPKSFYPRMSNVPSIRSTQSPLPSPLAHDQSFQTPTDYRPSSRGDYFGAPRAESPESAGPLRKSMDFTSRPSLDKGQRSFDALHRTTELNRDMSVESTSSSLYSSSLLPPRPLYARKTPSIRSIPMDSSDDENPGFTPDSSVSQNRKLSSSSGRSMPQSPLSPFQTAHIRSPSVQSERSISSNRLSRPAFNFSRPLSRSTQPSMEFPSRQGSQESRPSMDSSLRKESTESRPSTDLDFGHPSAESHSEIYGDYTAGSPTSVENERFFDTKEHLDPVVPSYTYSKYSLPRGRMLGRDSIPLDQMMPAFEWEQTQNQNMRVPPAQATAESDSALPIPPHSHEGERTPLEPRESKFKEDLDSEIPPKSSRHPVVDNGARPSAGRASSEVPSIAMGPPPTPNLSHQHQRSMTSMNSGSTIKAPNQRGTDEMTAEDHLNKGIDCHENGSLKESTYHLRIAARQNNPTAMLLYALACRHGWGMRPNPQDGVQWLRKAMDCASIELENDEDPANRGRQGDVVERRARKAQFALSVYELGVSHMNGWGIEPDKALALRCFEIASDWGDADAMAETGFCYAQGVGCKKDLKKAARYYRKAEAKGMSMVGNSWCVHRGLQMSL